MQETPFKDLGISDDIQASLRNMNFEKPTPVQELTIGGFLEGADLLVQAPTGTGKTGAFGVPIVQQIDRTQRISQALILCPTRELAVQVAGVLRNLAKNKPGIRIVTLYGGENIRKQLDMLHKTPHIIVATPGRLMDHMHRQTVQLKNIRTVVLDEADRMLDMGFRRDMEKILRATPKDRQTVFFSATIPQEIYLIANQFLKKDAREIRVEQESLAVETVKQYYTIIPVGYKNDILITLLKNNDLPLTLIFVNMKHKADRLAAQLRKKGFKAAALHGDMSQNQRDRVMKEYRLGKLDTLVATDIAARGIDVKNIDAVINYDAPLDDESYVHRIGRTGRAEQEGVAYTFINQDEDEIDRLRKMIKNLKIDISPTADSPVLPEPVKHVSYGRVSGQSFHSINPRRRGRGRR
ncbi:DEAD/DEAH box helicase [Christensenella timonensis]|uniref:DEAD/DEAH box helicase n=1 Tax=Christensenella timonensis TaxID=1816678 RepID=UPI00082D66A2|nr:DEAD/DEAH box helicase [Christensenella timonensis]